MDNRIVENICSQIYKRFPEVDGAVPKIIPQPVQGSHANYLFTFKGSGTTEDGKSIQRLVRVVASEKGKIIKVTTSR
jgi:hypothetical protein